MKTLGRLFYGTVFCVMVGYFAGGQKALSLSPDGSLTPALVTLYQQAATTCPGLDWTSLAAVGFVESRHGSNPADSTAGAQGPMQFMPATWERYGVDATGDLVASVRNQRDAVFGAANLLCANGAGNGNLAGALFAYNHSQTYVSQVLGIKGKYDGGAR